MSTRRVETGKDIISYDARSFRIRGKRVFLVGGEFHYFRVPHELWEDRLIKMKRAGANFVATYIPWNWHEPREGEERWEGDFDLERFITISQQVGLYLVVKPGPYICAEWDFGGYPDWILAKHIPLRVLDERHLQYVRRWYEKVAQRVVPHLITNGGNIICVQVENEYDHLMRLGEEKISEAEALEYFERLAAIMDELGIDVPKFANEAEFLHGTRIIDTRTYYPNIPWIWMWEFGYFDRKILNARRKQPTCPTMIMELQSGWFSQFGQPIYIPPLEVTEGVSKSVVMLGASLLNYYMFVGGTTFPFWGCRGDRSAHPPGQLESISKPIGTTTTYDFGGSPVREWGEIMAGRYDFIRTFTRFLQDFSGFIFDSDLSEEIAVDAGTDVAAVSADSAWHDRELRSAAENFTVLVRKKGNQHLVAVRNLAPYTRRVRLFWKRSGRTIFEGLELLPHETRLLPLNIQIRGTRLRIVRSTSELAFVTGNSRRVIFGLYGKAGRTGETVLNVPARVVRPKTKGVKVSGSEQAILRYRHDGVQVVSVQGHTMLIAEDRLAGKLEVTDRGLLLADSGFVRQVEHSASGVHLRWEVPNERAALYLVFDEKARAARTASGPRPKLEHESGYSRVTIPAHRGKAVDLEWLGSWKARTDYAEVQEKYDDRSWQSLELPTTLEDAGVLEHGYVWYRGSVPLSSVPAQAHLVLESNDVDHQYIFVNGRLVWDGITGRAEIDLAGNLKKGVNLIAILYRNFFHNKAHPSEGPILKYSGIRGLELVTGGRQGQRSHPIKLMRVRAGLAGLHEGYHLPAYDDSAWVEVPDADRICVQDGELITWLRRRFRCRFAPGYRAAIKLSLPAGGERCLIYLNGRAVGHYEGVGPQRDFYLPEPYLADENLLAIVLEGRRAWLQAPQLGTYFEHRVVDLDIELSR